MHHRIHGQNQTNGSLAKPRPRKKSKKKPSRKVVRNISTAARSVRRAQNEDRDRFSKDMKFALPYLNKVKGLRAWLLRHLVPNALVRLDRYDTTFIDIPLLVILIVMRRELFFSDEDGHLRRIIRCVKGKKYYEWKDGENKSRE